MFGALKKIIFGFASGLVIVMIFRWVCAWFINPYAVNVIQIPLITLLAVTLVTDLTPKKKRLPQIEPKISRPIAPKQFYSPQSPRKNRRWRKQKFSDSSNFYRLPKWRSLRELVFRRDGKVCANCKSTQNLHIDHIKPRSKHPDLELDINNLQVLCKDCNMLKSNHFDFDFRNKA